MVRKSAESMSFISILLNSMVFSHLRAVCCPLWLTRKSGLFLQNITNISSLRVCNRLLPSIFRSSSICYAWKKSFCNDFERMIPEVAGIRLWQERSQGYGQSISLLIPLLKYQSPTASAMVWIESYRLMNIRRMVMNEFSKYQCRY